jgi:hypothetical protein
MRCPLPSVCVASARCRALRGHLAFADPRSRSATRKVRALRGVPVTGRAITSAIDDAGGRLDPEVAVAVGSVARERSRGVVDLDPVVGVAAHHIARDTAIGWPEGSLVFRKQ